MQKQILGNNVFSTARLLSGYSLENIFKAVIAPNIKPEKPGKLPKALQCHNLLDLCKKADVIVTNVQKKSHLSH